MHDRSTATARAAKVLRLRSTWLPPPDDLNAKLLHSYRGLILGLATVGIATAWDTGIITANSPDRLPHQEEVFAHLGVTRGLASSQLALAYDTLRLADQQLEAAREAIGGNAPLDQLCAEHGIDALGSMILLLIAAPSIWGEVARVYGILANDPDRPICDEHLLSRLMGEERRLIARQLEHDAPLIRHGLVRVVDGRRRPFQALIADETVVRLLRGEGRDSQAERGVERITTTVQLDDFLAAPGIVDAALSDIATLSSARARVVVRGSVGSGRRTLLACLARLAGKPAAFIDVPSLVRENRVQDLRAILQRADLRGWLPCVDGVDSLPPGDDTAPDAIRAALDDHDGPVGMRLGWHSPPLAPGYALIDLPLLSIGARSAQWSAIAAEMRWEGLDANGLASRFSFGPGTIRRVVTQVAEVVGSAPPQATLETALRRHVENRFGGLASRVTATATIADIVLPTEGMDTVEELVARHAHWNTVYDTWGLGRLAKTSRGLILLIEGPSGTGKTMLAGVLARALGIEMYRVDLPQVFSKWIGETEKNLARIFDAAEQARAMLLFDEADSVFARRGAVNSSVDRYSNLEINYVLQRLETFDGVAVLTTNLGSEIDPAFRRRMSCTLTLPFPDAEAREHIWRNHLPRQMPTADTIDVADLARRHELSGGAIRNAAVRAAFYAAADGTPVSQFHIERAVRAEVRDRSAKVPDGQGARR